MKRFSGKKITVDLQVVCIWICACLVWQVDMAYGPFIERFQRAFSGFSGVKFDITASWTNLAKWIKVTFHSSPFCFGQPSFVQMRLTKLLSMLPNYSLHYTAASVFFWLVISGSVYNEQKPMWTCKQAINSWMHIPEPSLSMDWLINSRICWWVISYLCEIEILFIHKVFIYNMERNM